MLKKLFRAGELVHWQVQEKETIDEVIFRTTKVRNRLCWNSWLGEACG